MQITGDNLVLARSASKWEPAVYSLISALQTLGVELHRELAHELHRIGSAIALLPNVGANLVWPKLVLIPNSNSHAWHASASKRAVHRSEGANCCAKKSHNSIVSFQEGLRDRFKARVRFAFPIASPRWSRMKTCILSAIKNKLPPSLLQTSA